MRPADFDDVDEDVPVIVNRRKLLPEHKLTIKKMIRTAIKWQNAQVLFTCRECCFYMAPHKKIGRAANCRLSGKNQLVTSKLMPTQLPECFTYDPLGSAFAGVLEIIHTLGIDFNGTKQGWATAVGRIAQRADRYGYITGITQRNLDKYGS